MIVVVINYHYYICIDVSLFLNPKRLGAPEALRFLRRGHSQHPNSLGRLGRGGFRVQGLGFRVSGLGE